MSHKTWKYEDKKDYRRDYKDTSTYHKKKRKKKIVRQVINYTLFILITALVVWLLFIFL